MIIDARSVSTGAQIEADICIVGAGLAGLVLAREFIGTSVRICLLESGGRDAEPAAPDSPPYCQNGGLPYAGPKMARARRFGGSTHQWNVPIDGDRFGARLRPLDPIDFEQRDWVPGSGWPFPKTHLDPYYDKAQAICHVEPTSFEVDDWQDQPNRALALSDDRVQTIIYKFVARDTLALGYTEEVSRANNITSLLHADVLDLETPSIPDRITRSRVATLNGTSFNVSAKLFILAGGGIEIPRLLLLSRKSTPNGLGNENDLVGRFFMEHPHFWQGIFVPNDGALLQSTALYNEIHSVKGVAVIGKLALAESVLRRERLLNQNVQLIPGRMPDPFKSRRPDLASVESFRTFASAVLHGQSPGGVERHLKNIAGGLHEIAIAGARKVRNRLLGNEEILVYHFANMMEQTPNPESRVTLGSDRDVFGQLCAKLSWHIAPQDIRSAVRTQQILAEALESAGLGRFYSEMRGEEIPTNLEGGYHYMGTTKMHPNPRHGVVDADCRLHSVQNLFIAGPSVFPTSGYANPVLTIIAMTLRLADHLKREMSI
ncbi:MAG: hypothetical protein QOI34_1089 [Verrucomicrobiota bacterium]